MTLALTDRQMQTVQSIAQHVPIGFRHRYLELTAEYLRTGGIVNDREVSAAATLAMRRLIGTEAG
jgi:hypothetical protein